MTLISNDEEFCYLYKLASDKINELKFFMNPKENLFIDGLIVFHSYFFEVISELRAFEGFEDFVVLGYIGIDPIETYFRRRHKYPATRLLNLSTKEEYIEALGENPAGPDADAALNGSTRYLIFPIKGDWLIYGDRRDPDIALFHGPEELITYARSLLFYEQIPIEEVLKHPEFRPSLDLWDT